MLLLFLAQQDLSPFGILPAVPASCCLVPVCLGAATIARDKVFRSFRTAETLFLRLLFWRGSIRSRQTLLRRTLRGGRRSRQAYSRPGTLCTATACAHHTAAARNRLIPPVCPIVHHPPGSSVHLGEIFFAMAFDKDDFMTDRSKLFSREPTGVQSHNGRFDAGVNPLSLGGGRISPEVDPLVDALEDISTRRLCMGPIYLRRAPSRIVQILHQQ